MGSPDFTRSSSLPGSISHYPPGFFAHAENHIPPYSLKVRKQRQSNTTNASPGAGRTFPAATSRRAVTVSHPPTFARMNTTLRGDNLEVPMNSARAVTLGTPYSAECRRKPDGASQPAIVRSLSQEQVAEDQYLHQKLHKLPGSSIEPDHQQQGRSSFRRRVLSRVMSGIVGKSDSSYFAAGSSRRRFSAEDARNRSELGFANASKGPSSSTVSTAISLKTALGAAIPSISNPLMSTLTSPKTLSSFIDSKAITDCQRSLLPLHSIAITRPKLKFLPGMQYLSPDRNRAMFMAVQVSTQVDRPSNIYQRQRFGLDIAVIIDNS